MPDVGDGDDAYFPSSLNGSIHVFGICFCDLQESLASSGILRGKGFSTRSVNKLSIDVKLCKKQEGEATRERRVGSKKTTPVLAVREMIEIVSSNLWNNILQDCCRFC